MALYLCHFHNYDGDERGWVNKDPEITCQACRHQGYFTPEEIEDYKRSAYKRIAIYSRMTGYPETLHVVMNDDDSIFEAERIAPQGEFRLDRLAHADPCVYGDNNSVVLAKPPKGKTLEDIRDDWDKAPRIVANAREERKPLPQVYVVNVTPVVLNQFNLDYNEIFKISPEDFELLVLDRLHAMGLCVERVGSTFARDGGIDIVFWPKPPFPMPFLAAAQVKHHRSPRRRTSVSTVREFAGVLRPPFHFGMVVTNTAFTPDAAWFASQKQGLLRLRDMYDLRRWIASDFANEAEWREMPRVVEICPGVKVQLTIGNLILPEP